MPLDPNSTTHAQQPGHAVVPATRSSRTPIISPPTTELVTAAIRAAIHRSLSEMTGFGSSLGHDLSATSYSPPH